VTDLLPLLRAKVEVWSNDGEYLCTCPLGNGDAHLGDPVWCDCRHEDAQVEQALRYLASTLPEKCPEVGFHRQCERCENWTTAYREARRQLAVQLGDVRTEVEREKRRLLVRETALAEFTEEQAAGHAAEWFGVTGDRFDPEAREPESCVLEFAPGRFALAPGVNFLFGPRSSLKTWLAYEAVRQEVARGRSALILDYEMSYSESMRRLHVLGASSEDLSRVVYIQPEAAISDAARAQVQARFGESPPSVVVLDSVGISMSMSGFSTNDESETAQWWTAVPRWMKKQWPGTVVLLIDHVPKGEGGAARDPIGSSRKGNVADGLLSVSKLSSISRRTRGSGRVTLTKDRQGMADEDSPLLDFEFGGGGPLVLLPADPDVTSVDLSRQPADAAEMRRIARYVGEHEGAKVEEARGDLGIHSATFTDLKDRLVDLGVIEHRPRAGLFKGGGWGEYLTEPD
jgi:hypothetical protein